MAIAEVLLRGLKPNFKSEVKVVEREEDLVRTPWQILEKSDSREAGAIRSSVIPLFFVGGNNFVPMSEEGDGRLICKEKEGDEETNGQASIWLNPEKWHDALSEFEIFTKKFDSSLKWLVLTHRPDDKYESIIVTPIRIDPKGHLRGAYTYSLDPDGHLSLVNEYEFYDLGYLEPERILNAKADALLRCFMGGM